MPDVGSDILFDILRPERMTAVVDVGANPIDGDPPYKAMLAKRLCSVTGFEPQADALAQLDHRKGPHERYLPHAIGDGRERTLYVCHAPGLTSLLRPDPEQLALFNEFPLFGRVEREMPVATHRLDDIEAIDALDFLKVDAQGSELEVLHSGRRKLSGAVVIQVEVSFVTLYRDQPGLGVIDTTLRGMGFIPHCIAELRRWPIAPTVLDGNPRKPMRQVMDADFVYVRDFSRPENMGAEQWKQLAMIAHHCYGSVDLVRRAIKIAAQIGAVPPNAPEEYLRSLRAPRPDR
jgi:FkbM family methyltransferase